MALQFSMTSQAGLNGVKVLNHAPSGIGKTVLCATAPTPIILSAEGGLLSLRRENLIRVFGPNAPGISYDIPVIQITTMADFQDAYRWMAQSYEAKQFQTACLDSLTEIAEKVLANQKLTNKDPRKAYGEMMDIMIAGIKAYRDLPGKHVYMSAKQEMYKDEATGMMKYGPMMPGNKVGQQLPYLFDEVFRYGVMKQTTQQGEQLIRFLQTQPDQQYEAKDRSGALDPVEYPNLTRVFNKILGVQ